MVPDADVAVGRWLGGRDHRRRRASHDSEDLFEERLVAWNRQGALVGKPVLFFGLYEEALEDGVVQVRRAHDEPLAAGPHADRHVSGGNVGRRRRCQRTRRRDARLLPPTLDHLSDPNNVSDLVAFSYLWWHYYFFFLVFFIGKEREKAKEKKKKSEKVSVEEPKKQRNRQRLFAFLENKKRKGRENVNVTSTRWFWQHTWALEERVLLEFGQNYKIVLLSSSSSWSWQILYLRESNAQSQQSHIICVILHARKYFFLLSHNWFLVFIRYYYLNFYFWMPKIWSFY